MSTEPGAQPNPSAGDDRESTSPESSTSSVSDDRESASPDSSASPDPPTSPAPSATPRRKTTREAADEKRQAKLDLVQEQVESGALVIREMTDEERQRYPPRPPQPNRMKRRWT